MHTDNINGFVLYSPQNILSGIHKSEWFGINIEYMRSYGSMWFLISPKDKSKNEEGKFLSRVYYFWSFSALKIGGKEGS